MRYVKVGAWKLLSDYLDGGHKTYLMILEPAVPTRLPDKPRAKSIRVDERNVHRESDVRARYDAQRRIADLRKRDADDRRNTGGRNAQEEALDNIDWLALFALSLGFSAMFMAALVYRDGDPSFAAAILFGTACIIALCLGVSKAPGAQD